MIFSEMLRHEAALLTLTVEEKLEQKIKIFIEINKSRYPREMKNQLIQLNKKRKGGVSVSG